MKQRVRLRTRPSRDGKSFAYFMDYEDEDGKRRRVSSGHADRQTLPLTDQVVQVLADHQGRQPQRHPTRPHPTGSPCLSPRPTAGQ